MIRKLLLSTLGAFTIGLASLGLGSAEASGPRLTPNGFCGALNMINFAAIQHMVAAMFRTAPQGNTGMFGAEAASVCR